MALLNSKSLFFCRYYNIPALDGDLMGRGMLSESPFVVPVADLMLKAYPMLNQVLPGTVIHTWHNLKG